MLWSFGAINSHLVQSGFKKRVHLPTDFMKRKIICVGQNRHIIILIKEDLISDNKGQLFTVCQHGAADEQRDAVYRDYQ